MTWSDCEPYGSKQVHTPNMSKLADQGMCLDGMFTATAMCAPTRQQLYTGLFPVRNGAYPNHSQVFEGVKSLPHYLSELGYRVALIGKTHFGPASSFPFEILAKSPRRLEAIQEFINRDESQPYCLVVCDHSPHKQWTSGDPSAYPPEKLEVPDNLIDTQATKESLSLYFAEVTDLDDYLGDCMKAVDESASRSNTLFAFTSEQGMTLPFGGKWTCYDSGLKTAFIARWPGHIAPGSRSSALTQYVDVVPTFIEAAGGDPNDWNTGRADAHGKTGFDGKSFLSVLKDSQSTHSNYVYGVQTTKGIIHGSLYPIRSVRSKRYKYIQNLNHTKPFNNAYTKTEFTTGKYYEQYYLPLENAATENPQIAQRLGLFQHRPAEELYDVQKDPYELNNLAENPELKSVKARLKQQLANWMTQQGDTGIQTEVDGKKKKSK